MDIIPSPRTALMRPVAIMAREERNLILVADVQVFEDCRSWVVLKSCGSAAELA
jgi:hypothetical protein